MNMDPNMLLALSVVLFAICFGLIVWGAVPEEIEEDELFGYRLTKRKRLLEENSTYAMVLPLIKIFAHYARNVPGERMESIRMNLRDKLMRSGFMGAFTPNEFFGFCGVVALGTFAFVMVFTLMVAGFSNIGLALVAGFVSMTLPFLSLNTAISDRLVEIDRRLPYAVDLLVLSMRAGLDFMTALDRVVTRGQIQNPDDPIVQELGVVLQEMRVGTARTDALINLCERVQSDYLDSMVGSIIQSERRGTPLANVLEIQVDTIRNKRSAKIEKKASQAAVKILFPLMFIFCAVLVVIIGAMGLRLMSSGF